MLRIILLIVIKEILILPTKHNLIFNILVCFAE